MQPCITSHNLWEILWYTYISSRATIPGEPGVDYPIYPISVVQRLNRERNLARVRQRQQQQEQQQPRGGREGTGEGGGVDIRQVQFQAGKKSSLLCFLPAAKPSGPRAVGVVLVVGGEGTSLMSSDIFVFAVYIKPPNLISPRGWIPCFLTKGIFLIYLKISSMLQVFEQSLFLLTLEFCTILTIKHLSTPGPDCRRRGPRRSRSRLPNKLPLRAEGEVPLAAAGPGGVGHSGLPRQAAQEQR